MHYVINELILYIKDWMDALVLLILCLKVVKSKCKHFAGICLLYLSGKVVQKSDQREN